MAVEGRRQPGAGRGREPPLGRGGGPPGREFDRDPVYPPRDGRGPPPGRERSPLRGDPYDDRYRDPYARREPLPPPPRDPYGDPYRRGPPPPPHDDPYRDPYRDDPYRRDPYRRDPFDDPYRDPYYRDPYLPPPPPKKPLPADVQIICMNKQLQMYAESIESRLRQHALITDVIVIPEDMKVPQMVEEAARMKFLFAIIINSQNEVHKSLTLNILHGTPQEHRNMPMEDSIKLVASSFEKYIQTQREKAAPPPAAPPAAPAPAAPTPGPSAGPPPFVPPSADISYLLNLLADNRQLTVEELEKVIGYLRERKEKILVAEGRAPPDTVSRPAPPPVAAAEPPISSAYLQQQQQELQNKILNILNGSGTGAGPAVQAPPQSAQAPTMSGYGGAGGGSLMSTGRPQSSAAPGGAKPVINFDNPNVQKALDNLIQSGPNLLKSLPSTAVQPAPARPSGYQSMGQQGAPARTALSSYPQQQTPPQQQPQQGYGGQFQQYQQPMGGAQNQQRPMSGYGGGQGGPQRPLMSTRAPQQGVRPRY